MFYGKKEIKVKKSNRKVLYKYRKSGDLLVKHGLLYDKNAQVSAFFRRKKDCKFRKSTFAWNEMCYKGFDINVWDLNKNKHDSSLKRTKGNVKWWPLNIILKSESANKGGGCVAPSFLLDTMWV